MPIAYERGTTRATDEHNERLGVGDTSLMTMIDVDEEGAEGTEDGTVGCRSVKSSDRGLPGQQIHSEATHKRRTRSMEPAIMEVQLGRNTRCGAR